jgi:hypothetical protein
MRAAAMRDEVRKAEYRIQNSGAGRREKRISKCGLSLIF